jgi:hypothetical protein
MSLAFNTSPANSISNLTDLIEEVRDELDNETFALDKIYRALGRAESRFNRDLRVERMETEVALSITEEATDLPLDFLELRNIYVESSPDNPLRSMSPAGIRALFQGQAGTPRAYAIENRRIVVAPAGSASLTLNYYQRIPSLTVDDPANWLVEDMPDLYLHQVLAILFNKLGDHGAAKANQIAADGIIESANRAAFSGHWGSAPLVPMLVRQVSGVAG